MSNICEFVNKQNHVRKNDGSLDNARTIDRIFGAFTNQSKINTTRFTLTNDKKIFFKMLHKQFYDKLLNPDITTYAIGQELNNIHKIVVDIDCVNEKDCMFKEFIYVKKILCQVFSCTGSVYARNANKVDKKYKHGCHIILDAYVDSVDNENLYQHIINIPQIKELIEKYGDNFIDPAVFRNHQLFWIFGGCKNGSNMYMLLTDDCKLYNPYQKYIDCCLTFEEFCAKNPNYDFEVDLYDTVDYDPINIPTIVPPEYVKKEEYHESNYTGNHLDIQYLDSLLALIDGRKTEYKSVRLPIILGVSREFNANNEAYEILEKYLKYWNTCRGMKEDYHIQECKRTYFNSNTNIDKKYTIGTVKYLAQLHNPSKYNDWNNEIYGIDWSIYENNDVCEFIDDNQNYSDKAISDNKPTVNDLRLSRNVINNIVKQNMKESYENEQDYLLDRNKCLDLFVKYAKDRLIYFIKPSCVVYYNNDIEKKTDFEKTFEGFGKIESLKSYIPNVKTNIPETDFAKYMNKYKWRTLCDHSEFTPINGIVNNRIIEKDGCKILNTFTGYNPKIYSTEPIPDMTQYESIINDFIKNDIGNKISKDCVEYINSFPVYLRPVMLSILNISGGIDYCNYVIKYIAQLIQEPNNLLPVGLLFYSKCRQGKGILIKTISQIIGSEYVVECNTREELFGTHSVPFENTLLVNINEANASEFGKNVVDIMKSYIDGSKSRTANRKNIQAYQYTMKSRIITTTNNGDGFSFDIQNGNARINAFKSYNYMPEQLKTLPFYEKTLDVFKETGWYIRELYNYFNSIKYTTTDIIQIYNTEYMQNIIDSEFDPIMEWIKHLKYDELEVPIWHINERIIQPIQSCTYLDRIPASSLYKSFYEFYTQNKFGSNYSSRKFYLKLHDNEYAEYLENIGLYNGYTCYKVIKFYNDPACEFSDDETDWEEE